MRWDIRQMAKKVIRHERRLPNHRMIHPEREWFVGLGIFVTLLTVGTIYEVRNFMMYSSLKYIVETESSQHIEYNKGKSTDVLERFNEKAATSHSILERYSEDSLKTEAVENEADRTVEVESGLN